MKSVGIGILMGVSFSYFLMAHYIGLGNYLEAVLVALVISFFAGVALREMTLLFVAEAIGLASAILIATCAIAFSLIIPVIGAGQAESFLLTLQFTAASLITRTFLTIFFLIPPMILLFGILGVFLSETLTEQTPVSTASS